MFGSRIPDLTQESNASFLAKVEAEWEQLFSNARSKNEYEFAWSLCAEFRGSQGPGWNSTDEVFRVISDYTELLSVLENTPVKARVALSLYSHLAEASGFYEVPMNMMRVIEGHRFNTHPFQELVSYTGEGDAIAPNANKVMKALAGYAHHLSLITLSEIFRDAFCPQLRNAYAHADYVICDDGIHLARRNSGFSLVVTWEQFVLWLERAFGFFSALKAELDRNILSYKEPRTLVSKMGGRVDRHVTISYNEATGMYRIEGSPPLPKVE